MTACGRWPKAFFALAGLLACASPVHAHSGGLDKNGCHTQRKTGEYHCHRHSTPTGSPSVAPTRVPRFAPSAPSRLRDTAPTHPFRNCDEARAHGAAPVRRGDPGYGAHLDRDNDGVGCEPRRRR